MKNILFDLYGTLADIRTDEHSATFWRSCSRLLGMQGVFLPAPALKAQYSRLISSQEESLRRRLPADAAPEVDLEPVFRALFENAGVAADDRAVADFARAFRVLSLRRLGLFPGVASMLKTLRGKGYRLYLLSNAQALFTRPELTLLGLDRLLDGVLLSSEAGRKKPDRAFFQAALDGFGLEPEKTIMVGNDDVCDCWGAHRAGLPSVYVKTWQSPLRTEPLPQDCIEIAKIADLPNFLFHQ